jgi:hypothetical protein
VFLARSTRSQAAALPVDGPVPVQAAAASPPTAVPARARINTDESQLPRWLRPSVQAARHGRADDIR